MQRIGEINYNNFGSKMTIVSYRNAKDIDVYFEEYDWTFNHGRYSHFKDGNIICPYEKRFRGVGYLGEGIYTFRVNNKETKCYHEWMKILERGYDEKWSKKHQSYESAIVCEEWHNFQNFAKWYYNNYYEIENERMELDKDILVKGNKVYSPKTCIFVPKRINTLFTKSDKTRGEFPIGVHMHTKGNYKRLIAQCSVMNKNGKKEKMYLGCFLLSEPFRAFYTYKIFKENYIKQVADEYKDLIPQELYNAMYNYEVEIND